MSSTFELIWHAGFNSDSSAQEASPNLAAELTSSQDTNKLDAAFGAVISALTVLNHELNGLVPSESKSQPDQISANLVYAMAEIIRMTRRAARSAPDPKTRNMIETNLWRIETAWLAVLAGDIDDIQSHLEEEWVAGGAKEI